MSLYDYISHWKGKRNLYFHIRYHGQGVTDPIFAWKAACKLTWVEIMQLSPALLQYATRMPSVGAGLKGICSRVEVVWIL